MLLHEHDAIAWRDERELLDRLIGDLDRVARLVELDLFDREIERARQAVREHVCPGLLDLGLHPLLLELTLLDLALREQILGHVGAQRGLLVRDLVLLEQVLLVRGLDSLEVLRAAERGLGIEQREPLLLEIRGHRRIVELEHAIASLDHRAVLDHPADRDLPHLGARRDEIDRTRRA